jgi:AAA+ ATPase superfamily predicted ATPase/DNA-binding Lrp family transcriptional regulator
MSEQSPEFVEGTPIFTDREAELESLHMAAEALMKGRPRHIALSGLRRIGKTLLLKEFARRWEHPQEVIPIYLNIEDICFDPAVFAQRFVGYIAHACLELVLSQVEGQSRRDGLTPDQDIAPFLQAESLLVTKAADCRAVSRTAGTLTNELSKAKPDHDLMIREAFRFPELLAEEQGIRLMLLLDEFTELSLLGRYAGVGNPVSTFRAALQQYTRVSCVITSSAISTMMAMIEESTSPLFMQFRPLRLLPFGKRTTAELARKLADLDDGACALLYDLTGGHPFYITVITERAEAMARRLQRALINATLIRQAFFLEVLSPRGVLYNYCRYLYEISLERAKGYAALKTVLQVLAVEGEMHLSEIARRVRRSASATRENLKRLMEVDVITQAGRDFVYTDPVLRCWVARTSAGIELDPFPQRRDLEQRLAELEELFQQASNELGVAKEAEIRELLRLFNGQAVEGHLFGREDPLTLPCFRRVSSYESADRQIELDALAEGDETWAVEIKWQRSQIGPFEINKLADRAQALGARAWYIGKAGFLDEGVQAARERGVLLSSAGELEELSRLLKVYTSL